jgi:hypothetical protein
MPTYDVEGQMYVLFKTQVEACDGEEAVRLGQARAYDMQVELEPADEQDDIDVTDVRRGELWT